MTSASGVPEVEGPQRRVGREGGGEGGGTGVADPVTAAMGGVGGCSMGISTLMIEMTFS